MKLHFYKYQATGNDFVVVDNRAGNLQLTQEQIARLCHRKFGVGADGLMLIEKHPSLHFHLEYYNSDGSQSLCGNGSRAAVHMAAHLGLLDKTATFQAYDGPHDAELLPTGIVRLRMGDVANHTRHGDDYFIHTGSPHYVRFVDDVKAYPVVEEGQKIRYSDAFKPGGTNVNVVQQLPNNTLFVRTYERGVEDETLSCGTGITAAALAAALEGYSSPVAIKALGGELSVEFTRTGDGSFTNVYLIGPAQCVFEGDVEI
jgi:diaminopimelate epimerase